MYSEKRAVIMAGADIKDYTFYKPLDTDFLICADRGYRHCKALGLVPDVLLGDFDSLDIPFPEGIERHTYPAEKDETDLQLAIDLAIKKGFKEIYCIGVFGGRCDHFLGNIGLMKWARDRGASLTFEDGDTYMFLLSGEVTLSKRENHYLSLIPFFEDATVSLSGTKYTAENALIRIGDTLGISNEIKKETAHISVHGGSALVLLCRADKTL
ncbi:MAG: thiamine diphosphokinase [Clostridia bacterium]|nr:thiamine diphosphokinase [Clostridia bacterium]